MTNYFNCKIYEHICIDALTLSKHLRYIHNSEEDYIELYNNIY